MDIVAVRNAGQQRLTLRNHMLGELAGAEYEVIANGRVGLARKFRHFIPS
jgi:hypothetical protein